MPSSVPAGLAGRPGQYHPPLQRGPRPRDRALTNEEAAREEKKWMAAAVENPTLWLDDEIASIIGGNYLRVLREVCG